MTIRIEAERLLPGLGDVIDNGVILLDEGLIAFAGSSADAPDTPEAEVISATAVMPGMWECHGHFFGIYQASLDEMHVTRPQMSAMRVVADARAALEAGFTSVREVAGQGTFLARVIDEGVVSGPTIYASGSALSMTGGHGDIHNMDLETARYSFARHWGEDAIVDGPDECRAGVRRMLRLGARVIKICASGGVLSQLDDSKLPQFSAAELEAIVDEATRMELAVAAHCHGKRGIMAAIEAGVKTIEHGTFLDEEAAEAMIEKNVVLVPTRWIVETGSQAAKELGIPDYARQKMDEAAEHHFDAISLAVEKGVKIAMGSDIFASGWWGRNAEELPLMVECGMTPMQAIETATANGPATLGPQAPNSGTLAEGMDADLICVSSDPSQDVSVLTDPNNITHVFKGGVLVKG